MKKHIFLGRWKNDPTDRDAVAYISEPEFVSHYFGNINICGPNFSRGIDDVNFVDFDTDISEEDFNELFSLFNKLKDLGYGIKRDSDRYKEGMSYYMRINQILVKYEKLRLSGKSDIYNKIKESEKQIIAEQLDISLEEANEVIKEYMFDYWDKGIIDHVYQNVEEIGEDLFDEITIDLSDDTRFEIGKHFSYSSYGQDMVDNNQEYLELEDGRIIKYTY